MELRIREVKETNKDEINRIQPLVLECVENSMITLLGESHSAKAVIDEIDSFINDEDRVFFVAEVKEKIVGFFFGQLTTYPFSNVEIGFQHFIYVDRDFRRQNIGKNLVEAFENWVEEKGAKMVLFGVNRLGPSDYKFADELLKKKGYRVYGIDYFKQV